MQSLHAFLVANCLKQNFKNLPLYPFSSLLLNLIPNRNLLYLKGLFNWAKLALKSAFHYIQIALSLYFVSLLCLIQKLCCLNCISYLWFNWRDGGGELRKLTKESVVLCLY